MEDELGYLLLTPDRQAMGMTIEQARQSEVMTKGSAGSWI